MKSIMQEASSIAKAIEQGWVKAGSPTDFSVKILETPQKNFLGFTKHPAKIALYFDERPAVRPQHARPQRRQPQRSESRRPEPRSEARFESPREQREQQRPEPRERDETRGSAESQWSGEMKTFASDWLKHILRELDRSHITFTVEPNNVYLRITLAQPLMSDPEKEKRLLASLALLLLEALKRNFRVGLRRHKIILTHG